LPYLRNEMQLDLEARRHPVCDRICRDAAREHHHIDRNERTEDVLALAGWELRPLRPCCSSRLRRVQNQCVPVPPGTETEHASRYGHLIDT
jgi:hypothetical protein